MLRTPGFLKLLPLCLLAHAGLASAQQKPSEAPPKLEIIEQGSETPITVTPPKPSGGAKITETKAGGKVTEVQAKSGKSHYTMKPTDPQTGANRAPQWTVLEFGHNKKKKAESETAPEAASAPPPPAPAPATK